MVILTGDGGPKAYLSSLDTIQVLDYSNTWLDTT